jgi:hypothetical protein
MHADYQVMTAHCPASCMRIIKINFLHFYRIDEQVAVQTTYIFPKCFTDTNHLKELDGLPPNKELPRKQTNQTEITDNGIVLMATCLHKSTRSLGFCLEA